MIFCQWTPTGLVSDAFLVALLRIMAAPPKPLSVDIHTSVKEGDMAKVLEFLEEGGDVNVRCR